MPYIKKEDRGRFDKSIDSIYRIATKGELEYCIYKLMKKFMKEKENKYTNLHDCVYSAMHCADEFRRRYLDIRENEAMQQNGDIEV